MEKKLLLVTFILLSIAGNAQKWAVRGSFNMMRSYNAVNVTSMNSNSGETSINGEYYHLNYYFGRVIERPLLSSFLSIAIIRNFTPKHSVLIGYSNLEPYISYTITHKSQGNISGSSSARGISTPAIKINYLYTLAQNNKPNPASVSFFAGLSFMMKGANTALDTSFADYSDSMGNPVVGDDYQKTIGVRQPRSVVPYLNLGIDGAVPLGKRFKLGMELCATLGYKTLYVETITGGNTDASYTFDVKLKPYFFSGGIYLQYRIK